MIDNQAIERGIAKILYIKSHYEDWRLKDHCDDIVEVLEAIKQPEEKEKKEEVVGMELIEGKIMIFTENGIYTPEGEKIHPKLKLKVLADEPDPIREVWNKWGDLINIYLGEHFDTKSMTYQILTAIKKHCEEA